MLYDVRGSELFDAIWEQPEYDPTRREAALLAGIGDADAWYGVSLLSGRGDAG